MALNTGANDWQPSPAARTAGLAATRVYNDAPLRSAVESRYKSLARTQLPITPGLRAFRDAMVARFPAIHPTYMPGRSRPMLDTQRLDMHQAGRAVDFCFQSRAAGNEVMNYIIEHCEETGMQFAIWCANQFSRAVNGPARFSAYHGASMHRDHIHCELSIAAGNRELPWYRSLSTPGLATLVADSNGPPAPIGDDGNTTSIALWAIPAALVVVGGGIAIAKLT